MSLQIPQKKKSKKGADSTNETQIFGEIFQYAKNIQGGGGKGGKGKNAEGSSEIWNSVEILTEFEAVVKLCLADSMNDIFSKKQKQQLQQLHQQVENALKKSTMAVSKTGLFFYLGTTTKDQVKPSAGAIRAVFL